MLLPLPRPALFAIIVVAVIGARVPFVANTLVGEEGCFAFLVANPVPSGRLTEDGWPRCLIGSIDGQPIFASFEKPIVPYLLIEGGTGAITRPLDILALAEPARTIAARLPFLVLFLIGVAGLAWSASRSLLASGVTAYALTTPLAVGASLQPQLDGSVGVLLTGVAGSVLVASSRPAAFAVAGFLVGLGRVEWALAFGTAAVAALAFNVRLALALLAGVAAGAAASFAISPADYSAAFEVMQRVGGTAEPLALAWRDRIYVAPVLALLVPCGLLTLARRRLVATHPGIAIVILAAAAMFSGFLLGAWPGDGFPRYYAPALVLAACALTALLDGWPDRWRAGAAATLIALGLVANAAHLVPAYRKGRTITSGPGISLAAIERDYAAAAARAAEAREIALQYPAFWFYYPRLDFLPRDLGVAGALSLLRERHPAAADRLPQQGGGATPP